jgi:hypothetical protein
MPQQTHFLPAVRSQYAALPYPPCNPEDDRTRLVNHGCAQGGDVNKEIASTKNALASLPSSNWFVRIQNLHHDLKISRADGGHHHHALRFSITSH